MFYNLVEKKLTLRNCDMDYVAFGKGQKNLIIYPEYGHAAFEEAPDFTERVCKFLALV